MKELPCKYCGKPVLHCDAGPEASCPECGKIANQVRCEREEKYHAMGQVAVCLALVSVPWTLAVLLVQFIKWIF
jgi:hypothetical protein